jgi:hypothetical protein
MRDDLLRELAGRRRRDAAAALADVDLDEDVDRRAGPCHRRREPLDADQRVDCDRETHARRERGDTCELGRIDHLVRDVDVVDAHGGERFGFARLLHADADRARGALQPRDGRALVHLRVRPEAHAVLAREGRHRREVLLHRIEIDDKRWRVDRLDRVAASDRRDPHSAARGTVGQSPSLASSRVPSSRCEVSLQPTSVKRSPVKRTRLIAALPSCHERGASSASPVAAR